MKKGHGRRGAGTLAAAAVATRSVNTRAQVLTVLAVGETAEVGLVDRVADRLDAAIAENELRDAGVPATELLAPDGVRVRPERAGRALGRRRSVCRRDVTGALRKWAANAGAAADEGPPDAGVDRAVADLDAAEHPRGDVLFPGEEGVA